MAQQGTFAQELGEAWGLLRKGSIRAALDGFEKILKTDPDHLDAHFGAALALKAEGQRSSAQSHLERCLALARAGRQAEPKNDRFLMLERIIQQRITELGAS
jgi:Tfp pilus assembly protein PilF